MIVFHRLVETAFYYFRFPPAEPPFSTLLAEAAASLLFPFEEALFLAKQESTKQQSNNKINKRTPDTLKIMSFVLDFL